MSSRSTPDTSDNSSLSQMPTLLPTALLGTKFRVENVLGEGAFGRVYLAFDTVLRRSVAIKELLATRESTDYDTYVESLERFGREARAAAVIAHPNVVAVFDLAQDANGSHYLIMEYVLGTDLRKLLQQVGSLPVEQVTTLALDVTRALEAIHEQDIVHRDLKPANIMLTRRGVAKLTDFGIAQVGHESQRTNQMNGHPGTPLYMSPEQAGGYDYIDGRSDLYSLGLVLYEALVGEPFARKHRPLALAHPDTPPDLVAIIDKLIQRNIEHRYQSATDVLRDLEAFANGPPAAPFSLLDGSDSSLDNGPLSQAQASQFSREVRPLIARGREQNLLANHLAAALAGQGSLVLIGGEAGVGKSALVDALSRSAITRGALLLTGRCYDLNDTPPYGPWREIRDRFPDPDAATAVLFEGDAAGAKHQAALFAQVHEALADIAARQSLLIVLDNMHWADSASLDLLRAFARGIAELPVLIVVTYRTEETATNRAFATLLPPLVRESAADHIELRRFTAPEVYTLVETRYQLPPERATRLASYLFERSEGNAFFLEELLRTLEDDGAIAQDDDTHWSIGDLTQARLPSLLNTLVERRLERLSEDDRRLLAVAAVIGQEVPFDLWVAVSKVDEETLVEVVERAAAERLVRETPDGTRLRFFHSLLREGLYESVPPMRRRIQHRRVAETLAAQPRPDADAVATHFRQAGDPRAIAWLVRAGERAQASFAWGTAAERLSAALMLMAEHDAGPDERGWLIVRLAWLRRFIAPAGDVALLEAAERLADEADDPALAAYALAVRGVVRCLTGDVRRGLPELEDGVESLVALPASARGTVPKDAPTTRELQGAQMAWFAFVGRFAEAQLRGSEVVVDWDDRSAPSDALHGFGWVNAYTGRPEESLRAFKRAKETYGATDNAWAAGFVLLHELQHLVVPFQADNLAARRLVGDAAEEAWAHAPELRADLSPRFARVPLLVVEGEWAEAWNLATATLPADGSVTNCTAHASLALAELAAHRGETDRAWAIIRAWLPDGPQTVPGTTLYAALCLVRVAASLATDAGDLATARQWLAAHDRWLAFSRATLGQADGALAWARFSLAAGDTDRAQTLAAAALTHATAPRQPLTLIAAHRLLGQIAAADGRKAEAEDHFGKSLALAADCAAPFERARTLLALATVRATDDPAASRVMLEEVRALCTPLDARPTLDHTRALLASLS